MPSTGLPNTYVRTVVIYDQEYEGRSEETRLRGARLVNAIGRAGRAGKETEGWIVLVRGAEPSEADFQDLSPDNERLAVTSTLVTETALHAFAELEDTLRGDEDAIFSVAQTEVSDFISFIWLVLSVEEEAAADPSTVSLARIIDLTLASFQSTQVRSACLSIAESVQRVYVRSESSARRRWPRTGTSISSAQIIDAIASRVANRILADDRSGELDYANDPVEICGLLQQVIEALLALPEAPRWSFRASRRGESFDVPKVDMLVDWLKGMPLPVMAETHLAAADSAAWRIEQMVDVVTGQFEHYLSWTIGALIELVNLHLARAGTELLLCPELGRYIRYGVRHPAALLLMTSGIRSRRLAKVVADSLPATIATDREAIRVHIASMSLSDWRTRYVASTPEVIDLLEFVRPKHRSLLRSLLDRGTASVEVAMTAPAARSSGGGRHLALKLAEGEPAPAPLGVYAEDVLIASVASQDHADLSAIIETGLEIEITIDENAMPVRLIVALPEA